MNSTKRHEDDIYSSKYHVNEVKVDEVLFTDVKGFVYSFLYYDTDPRY